MDKAAKKIKKTTTKILSNYHSMRNFTATVESKGVGDLKNPIQKQANSYALMLWFYGTKSLIVLRNIFL